ncbi:hypothetical protein [Arthrobacter sp. VKM Ac-2550]|uniref:hypothetical protein n=1 Tax=Crystallibacter permensis TaxID=1938888 RepID=UPI002227336C|nr:hypothetical protein [Arthrobacter sp. VKM Ac-2550]MCW2135152.1 hypothetical protein [Arthrobacter sp. VKM Ac-2550]
MKDSGNRWSALKLASVTNSAHASGWSRRSIAAALNITTERIRRFAEIDAPPIEVPGYQTGASFPADAARAFLSREDQITARIIVAQRELTALLRFAHGAGWRRTSSWPSLSGT